VTPAQAAGVPDYVTDVPVQGPTDPGIRANACLYAQNTLPAKPACVDCSGPVPPWAQTGVTSGLSGPGEGLMLEAISYGGKRARGFALGGPTDPDIFATLTPAQQAWIGNTLVTLNTKVMQASGTTCATWGPSIPQAAGCFQSWYNNNYAPPKAPGKALRTDGVVDQDTLSALITIAGMHATDYPTYPATPAPLANPPVANPTAAPASTTTKKLSTGAMVGIGVAGAAVVGGIALAATRKKGGRRRR